MIFLIVLNSISFGPSAISFNKILRTHIKIVCWCSTWAMNKKNWVCQYQSDLFKFCLGFRWTQMKWSYNNISYLISHLPKEIRCIPYLFLFFKTLCTAFAVIKIIINTWHLSIDWRLQTKVLNSNLMKKIIIIIRTNGRDGMKIIGP